METVKKVAVLNFCGNIGKTTLSKHLIAPALGVKVTAIESLNDDDGADIRLHARQFKEIQEDLTLANKAVLDIGSSNIEEFVTRMVSIVGSCDLIDLYLIPVTPDPKTQKDTVATINRMLEIGVPASKICLLFNRVDPRDDFTATFRPIMRHAQKVQILMDEGLVVWESELFTILRAEPSLNNYNIKELAGMDPNEWAVKAREARDAGDEHEKRLALNTMSAIRMAKAVQRNIDGALARIDSLAQKALAEAA